MFVWKMSHELECKNVLCAVNPQKLTLKAHIPLGVRQYVSDAESKYVGSQLNVPELTLY